MNEADEFNILSQFILNETGIVVPESNINATKRFLKSKLENLENSMDRYIQIIKKSETEFYQLINAITINETYFFREEKYFKLLDSIILPEMRERYSTPPTVWSGAASTGEEAISLSLLINKFWNSSNYINRPVIATDIDINSMNQINKNIYTPNSFREDGKDFHYLLHNCSTTDGKNFSLNKKILDSIHTVKLNLIIDDYKPLFKTKPKIIFLCNVLIYMEPEIRELIIDKAVEVLDDNGYLFVSSSNTATTSHPKLELLQNGKSFYFIKRGNS
ncbi:MAG: hypothetical protein JXR64_10895 [Spirochaetales bacterium]|nr:hypothetical protein [Spirochaetales bacterium]